MASPLGERIQGWRLRKHWSEVDLAQCLLSEGFQFDGSVHDLAKEITSLELTDKWEIKDPDLNAFSAKCARCLGLNRNEKDELELLVIEWLIGGLGLGTNVAGWH